jgi:type IV secretory pathway protease TraF
MAAKRRIIVRIAISVSTAFATVLILGAIVGLRLNIASNSLPPGIYRIAPRGKGSDLLICPTDNCRIDLDQQRVQAKGRGLR